MVRMSLDCDISIWLKYDITTWGLQGIWLHQWNIKPLKAWSSGYV